MKSVKLLYILGCSTLLTFSCQEQQAKSEPLTEQLEMITAPENIISVQEAEMLFTNYKKNRISIIEEAENANVEEDQEAYMATTSITFDFEMMKQYMAYIEQQAKTAQTNIKGLRVYFGQYGDSKKAKYPKAETVFFNPTMMDGNDEVSFAIQELDEKSVSVPVGKIVNNRKLEGRANLTLVVQSETTSLAGNAGSRRPPPMNDENDY